MKKIISLILIISLLFSLAACGQKATATWQEQYDLGVRYLNEGKYEEAVIAFNAAIEIDPKQAETYSALANAYIAAGDYEAAENAIALGRETCGDSAEFDLMADNVSFLTSGEMGVRLSDIYFDKAAFAAGQEVEFTISAVYSCPDGTDCLVMTGANVNEPSSYAMLGEDIAVSGSGICLYKVKFTPVFWEEAPFTVYINISEANHGTSWTPLDSDSVSFDRQGNIISDTDNNGAQSGGEYYGDLVGGPVYAEIVESTLKISDLQVIFVPGEDEDNPGSVGMAEYSFTVHGPANTCAVLIATWTQGSYPRESIDKDIVMMADVWSDMDMSDWGYPSLPASDWTARPVDAYEINTECEALLIGLDNDGNATGYVIIRSLITSDGSASGGYDTPDILTVSSDLPSIDELTFFGETLTYLTASEMESSAAANGWYTSNNSDWNDGEDYYWFQASPSAFGGSVSSIQYNNDTYWSFIGYDHYLDFADEPSIPIGLRDIYTLDSIETVFTKLGIAGAEDIANEILGICAKYPYDEALDRLSEYSGKLYIRNEVNGTHFNIGGGSRSGPADENGVYWVESFSATLSFFTEDYIYGLDFEFTNGFLTSVMINRAPTY